MRRRQKKSGNGYRAGTSHVAGAIGVRSSRKRLGLTRFDITKHIGKDFSAAEYLEACMEEAGDDAKFIAAAIGDIARAYGMTRLSREIGMSRVGLHKALDKAGNPSFDTILRVTRALGLKFVPQAA
jgi:probable addiction module antidote protein